MTMLAWERDDDSVGHSVARWAQVADGYLFHGTEVLVADDPDEPEVLSCTFSVRLGPDWVTRRVEARAVAAAGETTLVLEADEQRSWTVDGVRRADLDGCLDVDVAATPLTNTFPIRRLADLAVGQRVTTPIAWVDVPRLGVHRVDQTYERLPDGDGLVAPAVARWRYRDEEHGAFTLTVDPDGLVVDYEDLARRLR